MTWRRIHQARKAIKGESVLSLVGEQALTCANNRQRVDETESENDEVGSGNEEDYSDDEIDEGQ
jgi:hypothetical protein